MHPVLIPSTYKFRQKILTKGEIVFFVFVCLFVFEALGRRNFNVLSKVIFISLQNVNQATVRMQTLYAPLVETSPLN